MSANFSDPHSCTHERGIPGLDGGLVLRPVTEKPDAAGAVLAGPPQGPGSARRIIGLICPVGLPLWRRDAGVRRALALREDATRGLLHSEGFVAQPLTLQKGAIAAFMR